MSFKVSIGTYSFNPTDLEKIADVLKSGMLSCGKETSQFESAISNLCNKKYGVFVNSGQSALEVALEYAKYKLGKNKLVVICPTTTYAATLWAILRSGCEPLFYDVNSEFNLDFKLMKDVGDKADVILNVDLCGKVSFIPKKFRKRYFVIEDACEAVGNQLIGDADIVCSSYYVSHIITTGSGGMCCSDDENFKDFANSFISHGRIYGGDFTDYKDKWYDRFLFDKVGASYRSNNIVAALGLSQLQMLDSIVYGRRQNAKFLICNKQFYPHTDEFFIFPKISYWETCVFQFFPILINNPKIVRESLLGYLYDNGIDSRVLMSLTNQLIFKQMFGEVVAPNSDYINKHGFIVGCHQDLGFNHMKHILYCLENYKL